MYMCVCDGEREKSMGEHFSSRFFLLFYIEKRFVDFAATTDPAAARYEIHRLAVFRRGS